MKTITTTPIRFAVAFLAMMLLGRCALFAGVVTYAYDSLNRLTNVNYGAGAVISYTYDSGGNRLAYSGVVTNDAVSPTIAITSPTSGPTYTTTNATINLSGTASDNTGVTLVTWENDRGGIGTATGTTSWNINGVPLQTGDNVILVTAHDLAGNSADATLTVSRTPPQYTITASATSFGSISPSGTFNVNGGADQTFTAFPNPYYSVNVWLLDGNSVQTGGTQYTLSNIQANHSVQVWFDGNPPLLTDLSVSNATVRFLLSGPLFATYFIQASSNLVDWTTISTNTTLPGNSILIVDPGVSNQPVRFYRALLQGFGQILAPPQPLETPHGSLAVRSARDNTSHCFSQVPVLALRGSRERLVKGAMQRIERLNQSPNGQQARSWNCIYPCSNPRATEFAV